MGGCGDAAAVLGSAGSLCSTAHDPADVRHPALNLLGAAATDVATNLTVYTGLPAGQPAGSKRPALLCIHGGSYTGGYALDGAEHCGVALEFFARSGWAVFAINCTGRAASGAGGKGGRERVQGWCSMLNL